MKEEFIITEETWPGPVVVVSPDSKFTLNLDIFTSDQLKAFFFFIRLIISDATGNALSAELFTSLLAFINDSRQEAYDGTE